MVSTANKILFNLIFSYIYLFYSLLLYVNFAITSVDKLSIIRIIKGGVRRLGFSVAGVGEVEAVLLAGFALLD